MPTPSSGPMRFGVFEVDPVSGDLRKHGMRIKLRDRSFQVLIALLERPGQVVTRQELQERLWPGDTFVEFENGLNNAISRLREALGDSAESPRFVETLPRRGYRFLARVETAEGTAAAAQTADSHPSRRRAWYRITAVAAALALAFVAYRAATPLTARPPISSVAVLPFVVAETAADSPDEYVAFGMTEALIAELSRHPGLKVISQTSALRYKGVRKPLPQIARELGVGAVIEGSVVREGDHMRITVQLIDAQNDAHLWTQTYRREASTALAQQSDLASIVVAAIRARLLPSSAIVAGTPAAQNPEEQEAYSIGRFFLRKSGKDRERAREYLEKALAAKPDSARAHSGLADYYLLADSVAPLIGIPKAREHAKKALSLDENLADAHASLGFIAFYADWDWKAAEREFQRAIGLDPNHADARRWYAAYLSAMGRHAEAATQVQAALDLDPVSVVTHDAAAAIWLNARQFDRVIEQARRIRELDANDPRGHEHLANGYLFKREYESALAEVRKASAASREELAYLYQQAIVQGWAGKKKEAVASMAEAARRNPGGYLPDLFRAAVYAGAGEQDAAFQALEDGFRSRDGFLVTLKVTPFFDPLRDDPRFRGLLRRMNFPE